MWADPQPVPPWEWREKRYLATNEKRALALQYIHFPTPRLAIYSFRFYNTPSCEALMPFSIRPFRRFPVQCVFDPYREEHS